MIREFLESLCSRRVRELEDLNAKVTHAKHAAERKKLEAEFRAILAQERVRVLREEVRRLRRANRKLLTQVKPPGDEKQIAFLNQLNSVVALRSQGKSDIAQSLYMWATARYAMNPDEGEQIIQEIIDGGGEN